MKYEDELRQQFLDERNALFNNPTLEGAIKYFKDQGMDQGWAKPDVPLASVHKARLQWLDITNEQIIESMNWLKDHGYAPTWREAPPLTPERRDADRKTLGKEPL